MARIEGKTLLAYIFSRLGCVHPFTASRVLALAETMYYRAKGGRLTDAKYLGGPGTFYIEGLKELIEADECFRVREGDPSTGRRGCIEYTCSPPELDEEIKRLVEEAIGEAERIGDLELNKRLMEDEVFRKLLSKP